MIVDTHAHIFNSVAGMNMSGPVESAGFGAVRLANGEKIQVLPPTHAETTFPPEALVAGMDWAGVDKAVLLQNCFYGIRNKETLAACKTYADRLIGAALFDPWAENSRGQFTRLFDEDGFGILKLELSYDIGLTGFHPDATLDEPGLAWLWDELEARRLVVTLDLGPVGGPAYQTSALRKVIESHGNLKFVLCHLGFPSRAMSEQPALWTMWEEFVRLGELPNVWFDISALPHRAEEAYPFPHMEPWIRRAIELIGAKKLMWGTDAPGLFSAGHYQQLLTAYEVMLGDLPQIEREAIFGETALEVYPF